MSIQLSNESVVAGGVDPPLTSVTAGYELGSDGHVYKSANGAQTKLGDWITPQSGMGNYECEFTLSSGSALSSNTASTWANLGTTQSCALTKGPGTFTSHVSVQIRDVATHTVQATCTVTLEDLLSH